MHIWVDADACPRAIKEILYRAAQRVRVPLILVANRDLHVPRSPYIRTVRVVGGFDVADRHIADHVAPGDLVITGDIPLAAAVVAKDAHALGPRGEEFTEDNIAERLATRDLMEQLRSAGMETGGPATFGKSDRLAFANGLDRVLSRYARERRADQSAGESPRD